MASKPTIFFSHSSADKVHLVRLKELFVEKTSGAIDVFLSSDGQSIPLGTNWVHSLQDALDRATLMFVFVSPSSLHSSWLYFESGFSYSKKIRVIPLGYKGIDLAVMVPPLSLLQGFNIESESSLDNLIAIANDVFSHKHSARFTVEEFGETCAEANSQSRMTLGNFGHLAEDILITLGEKNLNLSYEDAFSRFAEMLEADGVEHSQNDGQLAFTGVLIRREGDAQSWRGIQIHIEPLVADVALPIVTKLLADVRVGGLRGLGFRLNFLEAVDCVEDSHKQSGRLFNSSAFLVGPQRFSYLDLEFAAGRTAYFSPQRGTQYGAIYLKINLKAETLELSQLRGLLDLVFERRIFFVSA